MVFIGALVYFVQHSVGFWGAFVGFLKAIIWPILLTYKVFGMLGL